MSIIICPYCNVDTAGNHEYNCPNRPSYYSLNLEAENAELCKEIVESRVKINCLEAVVARLQAELQAENKRGKKAELSNG